MVYKDDRVRHILDNLPALVAILDREQRYNFANRQHASWFGENPESLAGRHLKEVIGEQAHTLLAPCHDNALNGVPANYSGEVPFARGGEKFVYATCLELPGEAEEENTVLLMMTDVSAVQYMQQALDASTLRSHTILDTAVDAIVTIEEDGTVQACNSSTASLFGYSPREIIGKNVKILMPEAYATEHDGYLHRYLETGEKHIIGIGRDVTARKKDGREFPAHLAVGEFKDRGKTYFTGFIRDMTDQKKAEQEARAHLDELSHLTRLSAIESLASGITHEINQPLTAIVSMAQALLRMQNGGGAAPEMVSDVLERIVNQCVRVNTIVQQMREMARKSRSVDRDVASVNDIIKDVRGMLEYEVIQHDITLRTVLADKPLPVMVNQIQIEQVLLNLIQNGIHAVGDNDGDRILTIESRQVEGNPPEIQVTVTDNGHGLPETGQADIFDPFFTTKESGMGQGLSISRSIIETHGGKIAASNHPDGGAEFKFTLPALTEHE